VAGEIVKKKRIPASGVHFLPTFRVKAGIASTERYFSFWVMSKNTLHPRAFKQWRPLAGIFFFPVLEALV